MEFQHVLFAADIDKKKIRNVVRKTHMERRKISLSKDAKIRKQLACLKVKLTHVGSAA